MKASPLPSIDVLENLFSLMEPEGRLVWANCPRPEFNGTEAGWVMNGGYRHVRVRGYGTYLAHRLVTVLRGRPLGPNDVIDHINHDKLDNRASNLRVTTKQGNSFNRGPNKTAKVPAVGITVATYRSGAIRYRARIKKEGRDLHLGTFKTVEEAVSAYETAKKEITRRIFAE